LGYDRPMSHQTRMHTVFNKKSELMLVRRAIDSISLISYAGRLGLSPVYFSENSL